MRTFICRRQRAAASSGTGAGSGPSSAIVVPSIAKLATEQLAALSADMVAVPSVPWLRGLVARQFWTQAAGWRWACLIAPFVQPQIPQRLLIKQPCSIASLRWQVRFVYAEKVRKTEEKGFEPLIFGVADSDWLCPCVQSPHRIARWCRLHQAASRRTAIRQGMTCWISGDTTCLWAHASAS